MVEERVWKWAKVGKSGKYYKDKNEQWLLSAFGCFSCWVSTQLPTADFFNWLCNPQKGKHLHFRIPSIFAIESMGPMGEIHARSVFLLRRAVCMDLKLVRRQKNSEQIGLFTYLVNSICCNAPQMAALHAYCTIESIHLMDSSTPFLNFLPLRTWKFW